MLKCLPYLICMSAMVGCASGTAMRESLRASASVPIWCKSAGLGTSGQTQYVGRSDGAPSEEEAIQLATGLALNQLTSELGITVQSRSSFQQQEVNGQGSSHALVEVTIESKPITVRGIKVGEQFTAERGNGHMACVQVNVSSAEKIRLKRMVLGKTALMVQCNTDNLGKGACPSTTVHKLSEMLTARGAKLLPTVNTSFLDAASMERAVNQNAAYVAAVVIESRFLEEINGEFFAEANISLQRFDTADQKMISSIQVEPEKGGHLNARDAELAAITAALESLGYKLSAEIF